MARPKNIVPEDWREAVKEAHIDTSSAADWRPMSEAPMDSVIVLRGPEGQEVPARWHKTMKIARLKWEPVAFWKRTDIPGTKVAFEPVGWKPHDPWTWGPP